METGHLIIGIIGFFGSGAMIYFAKARDASAIVKPFLFTYCIEEEKVNRIIGLILGTAGMLGSFVLIIAGLTGRKILPFI